MKLHILSDLHLEFHDFAPLPVDCDLVVLAGDIAPGTAGMRWAERAFDKPVFYVPGNHEFYGHDFDDPSLTFPDGIERHYPGVRIFGATLWTDFNLYGNRDIAMRFSASVMQDYRTIRRAGRMLRPPDTMVRHGKELAWLREAIAKPFDGKTVVVTHHAPSVGSVHERYRCNPVNAAFASDLADMAERVDLWVHGHTHDSFDYRIGRCRVVANPRGYPVNDGGNENAAFDPALIVEVNARGMEARQGGDPSGAPCEARQGGSR